MSGEVYLKLREQLDQYSVGFPTTESGVELKILKKLFTEDEADMYLRLTLQLEEPAAVAARLGRDAQEAASLLDRMADKGLIFRLRKGDRSKYAAAAFLVGIYEYQIKTIDRELAELWEQYHLEAFHQTAAATLMRPIPINRSVDAAHHVATYEDSRAIMKAQKKIAVLPCICRVQQGLIGKGCDKEVEACFMFGSHATYMIDRMAAREVTVDEALTILDRAEEQGLVSQPFNSQNPGGMCNCCGDCCGLLRSLNMHPRPVELTVSNWFAVADRDECTGCETCLERCQMNAISMDDEGLAQIDLDRCIGCGLCVTTCPTEALKLSPKSERDTCVPPQNTGETFFRMAEQRGTTLMPLYMNEGLEKK